MNVHDFVIACFPLLFVQPAFASEPVNLVGEWQCVSEGGVYHDGFYDAGQSSYVLTIAEQQGRAFHGHYIWGWELTDQVFSPDDEDLPPYAVISEDRKRVTVKEEVLGIVGPGSDRFTMVDKGDTSRFDGAITDENNIEYTQIRPGEFALADVASCSRVPSE